MPAHASRTLAPAPSAPPSRAERRLLAPVRPRHRPASAATPAELSASPAARPVKLRSVDSGLGRSSADATHIACLVPKVSPSRGAAGGVGVFVLVLLCACAALAWRFRLLPKLPAEEVETKLAHPLLLVRLSYLVIGPEHADAKQLRAAGLRVAEKSLAWRVGRSAHVTPARSLGRHPVEAGHNDPEFARGRAALASPGRG